jgi:2-alkyl-3-oxoalkanoate reductase
MARSGDLRILVTGATGFIGASLLQPLADRVGKVRGGSRHHRPSAHATEMVDCDLDNPDQTRAAVAGSDVVVHTAYGSFAAMPEQCRTLLAAMSAAGTSGLVYFSSIAVYGASEGTVREDSALIARAGSYGEAKARCEDLIRQWVDEKSGLRRAIILRPGIVYGARSTLWVGRMIERIRCGAWGTFGSSGEGRAALIHVDDVAEIVVAACGRMAKAPETLPDVAMINVVGPETPSWNTYFQALAAADGHTPLRAIAPGALALQQVLAVLAKIWRRLGLPGGRRFALAPTPGELKLFALEADYASDKLETVLGLKATIGLQEGLRRSLPIR